MKTVKKQSDLKKIPAKFRQKVTDDWNGLMEAYKGEFKFDPENDGYSIFVENGKDDLLNFPHLNACDDGIYGAPWEDVTYYTSLGLYVVVIMCNNQFGLTVYFNEVGLDERLKKIFEEQATKVE